MVVVDFGAAAVLDFAPEAGAAELPVVAASDCGADGALAGAAGCAAAVSLAALAFFDFLVGGWSVVLVLAVVVAELELSEALDFFDFLVVG